MYMPSNILAAIFDLRSRETTTF